MREQWLRVSGAKVHYWEAGQGPPLLLLPSAAGRAVEYHALIPLLENTAHIFALDYPGFGQSDALSDLHSVDALAVFVDEWRAALALGQCGVAGFSMGGWLALKMALAQPWAIDRLVLIATAAGKDPDVPMISPLGLSFREILEQFYFRPEIKAQLARQKLSTAEKKEIHRSSRAFERLVQHGRLMPNLKDRLDEIAMPTLVVAAREDRSMPLFYQEQLHAGIPDAILTVFNECGHAIIAERPQDLADAIIAFLQKP